MSKFVSSDTATPAVRYQRALNKWLAAEANNLATNTRLMTVDPEYQILPHVTYSRFMQKVSDILREIIGDTPPERVLRGSFSGGASTSRSRTKGHPALKYTGKADVTLTCLSLVEEEIISSPLWNGHVDLNVVKGNVFFTVPKSTDIDRCACKEPDLNMYLQKGVGSFMKRQLFRVGINLFDQQRNNDLARLGSVDNSLATIDLTSASDSICRELVFQLLPITWYCYLDSIRSHETQIPGYGDHKVEMFSSMGNGFTFELQTCLYYSIARATAYFRGEQGVVSVFGDDIIVPSKIAEDLLFVLSFLGFSSNPEKTFYDGDFRESCGGHFINGFDVTPFYIRKPIDTLHDAITIANQLRRWATCDGVGILDPEVYDAWLYLANLVPKCFWGGHDTGDSSCLVSYWKPDNPRRLKSIDTGPLDCQEGGYIWWHDSKDKNPGSTTDSPYGVYSLPTGSYISSRRKILHGELQYMFLEELGNVP